MGAPSDPPDGASLARWKTMARARVADCRVFEVFRKRCRHERDGREHDFFVIDATDWVNVVARTVGDELVLVNQFRYGTEEFSLEIPGGMLDRGEDPIEAARRELREETGFGGGEARLLGRVRPNPAILSNWCHFVWIEGVQRVADQAWDEHEELAIVPLPVEQVLECARTGGIQHALTMNALFLFEPLWRRVRAGTGPGV